MRTDFNSNADVVQSIAPAAYTATATGTGVNLAGYGEAEVIVVGGTRTDGTHTPKVQESSDNSTFADVAAADLVGTALVAITSASTQRIGYIGTKQYIRVVSTVAGATTGAVYAAIVVRGGARKQPLA